jgi:UDP:flavonoid glycosyltransferase YjiC (YdhE family)
VRVERFVPHAHLLPRCDVVVSHGGSASVVGALAHGVPLVVLPMGADQPHNADRCEALGVGRTLDPLRATPDEIAAAVQTVLGDGSYRANARRLHAECAALPPATDAVPLLETLARAAGA